MKTNAKKTATMILLAFSVVSSTGCASGRRPWLANKEDTSSMDSYVAQAVSNIQYDTDVDFAQDYETRAETPASYTAADTRTAARPSVGSSDSCSSGCCH